MLNVTVTGTVAVGGTSVSVVTPVSTSGGGGGGGGLGISTLMIPLYILIFLLAVVGNSLVLATLARNKRMRTVTNVYLLNLAVSDILLGVFCMPFTLIGQLLRNFIFGPAMCKMISYFQAVSVSVAVWTLVAISLERYFAICRPLKSRRWQTQFHAYKMIAIVWLSSLIWNAPILYVTRLKAMRDRERHKCREEWPSPTSRLLFNLFLDAILLLVPLIIMSLAYSLIVSKLWKGLQRELKHTIPPHPGLERSATLPTMASVLMSNNNINKPETRVLQDETSAATELSSGSPSAQAEGQGRKPRTPIKLWILRVKTPEEAGRLPLVQAEDNLPSKPQRHAIRSNYMDKSIEAKKKVIRMLFVVVGEFFVCWAPLHVLNTWYLFSPEVVYRYVGSTGVSLVHLLAYISSCCNPITYCFMNHKFRMAFISLFQSRWCWLCGKGRSGVGGVKLDTAACAVNSDISGNDSTLYVGRASRSEVVMLEREERV